MSDAEYRRIMRDNITGDLIILVSPAEQMEYHRQTPVDMASEMACTWFDDHYHPERPAFVAAFSDAESKSLADFSAVFNDFTKHFDYSTHPIIEELLQNPDWLKVIEAAKIALAVFQEN